MYINMQYRDNIYYPNSLLRHPVEIEDACEICGCKKAFVHNGYIECVDCGAIWDDREE